MKRTRWSTLLRVGLVTLGLAAFGAGEAHASYLDLLVTNINGGNVTQYDRLTGASKGVFTSTNLANPRGIAIGSDGSVYVNDIASGNINKYNGNGGFLGVVASGLLQPHGMAIGPNGNLFVSQFLNPSQVLQYTTGTPGTNLGTFASGNGLSNATGVAFNPANNSLYVASSGSNQILVFNATTGSFVSTISGNGLSQPAGLFVAPNGNLFVANFGGGNVLQFNSAGTLVGTITGGGLSSTNGPSHAILNDVGDLLVAVTNSNQILRFTQSGGVFSFSNVFATTGLNGPLYLALAPVPEPTGLALMGIGVGGLLALLRRRGRRPEA